MKIDPNKKYRTKDGKWPVTIVSTNGPYPGFPVVGYAHPSSTPLLCHWSEDGKYPANTNHDLIEVREPREWTIRGFDDMDTLGDGPCLATGEVVRVREIID